MVIPREVVPLSGIDPVETTRRPLLTKAYLLGTLHDATVRKKTYRIGAKDLSYVKFLRSGIIALGNRAWIYREGKSRNYFIVEFTKSFLDKVSIRSNKDQIDYIRGYFDTDGGISRLKSVRYYLYFAQKDRKDLTTVRKFLEELGIQCGIIHNPSKNMDANYFRFYIRANSYNRFAQLIGS